RLHPLGAGRVAFVTASSAPFVETLTAGQDSALSLLLLTAALRLSLAGRDLTAGLVLGLGAHKPHLFGLVGVALLLQRRWRAAATMLAAFAALGALSVALLGSAGVTAYFVLLSSQAYRRGIVGAWNWKMISVSAPVRAVLDGGAAGDLIALVAAVALVA